ncbi:MAG: hypothetical protein R6V47_06120 [Candidatus Delongbacteria bacterium]
MSRSKKSRKTKQTHAGFFARLFDILTALVIIGIAVIVIYFLVFHDPEESDLNKDMTVTDQFGEREIYSGDSKDKPKDDVIDHEADELEREKIHSDIYEDDELIAQHNEELLSNITQDRSESSGSFSAGYFRSIDKWSSEYEGLKLERGADPDKDDATDNSHLICSIWENSAVENGMYFKGYMTTRDILKHIVPVKKEELRNGDLIVLKDGMIGMVVRHKSPADFKLAYASGYEGKVILVDHEKLQYYWFKPENFKGYFRISSEILN